METLFLKVLITIKVGKRNNISTIGTNKNAPSSTIASGVFTLLIKKAFIDHSNRLIKLKKNIVWSYRFK